MPKTKKTGPPARRPAEPPPDSLPDAAAGPLPPDEFLRVLRAASGESLTPAMLDAALSAGAPVNPDGRLELVPFAAWLAREAE